MGSSAGAGGAGVADTARRLAGRSLLAVGSGLAKGVTAVAKGVSALTTSTSDKEAVRCLKFAVLQWETAAGGSPDASSGGSVQFTHPSHQHLPVLLVGLDSGFQVWRLDGDNPAELLSRRDGPVKLLEVVPPPRAWEGEGPADELAGDRPLLAVVPAPEQPPSLPAPGSSQQQQGGRGGGGSGGQHPQQPQQQQQHTVQLYSLRSHGFVRSLSFGGEVLGVAASGRLLVVALRGQLQAFDACTLQHTFSCLTYTPPVLTLPPPQQHQQHQQFVTAGLTSASSGELPSPGRSQGAAASGPALAASQPAPAAQLAPFALGPRWLAYAADTPVPQASGQAVAQRLPLGRHDSHSGSMGGGLEGDPSSGGPAGGGGGAAGRSASGLTTAAVADAALAAAAKGGQQLKAGLSAVGSASFRYLSSSYSSWRQGGQQPAQRDLDALEADAAVAGTVVVRDAASRMVVAHFRAHTSPLAALQFSPGGTLLATASVAGHSINVFSIVPPLPGASAAADGGGQQQPAGHAVWLYRLYRGVTPAAICGVAFAPDASWVAVSSGRGTTHIFHTPAAAPGARPSDQPLALQQSAQQQQQQCGGGSGQARAPSPAAAGETGVLGRPPKQLAVARARKPGLLSGGAAGAATSAARNLYTGQPADVAPIAAAFLPAGPTGAADGSAASPGVSLLVVTQDGLLTRHLLRAPPAASQAAAGVGIGMGPAAPGGADLGSPGGRGGLERQDSGAGGAGGTAPAVLEEADRWDVARHASWPEREDMLPGLLSGQDSAANEASAGEMPGSGSAAASSAGGNAAGGSGPGPAQPAAPAAGAAQQQVWLAQAESGPLSAPGGAASASWPLPLWGDPQFRFYELQLQSLQRQRATAASAGGPAGGGALSEAAGGPTAVGEVDVWLERLPARIIQR